MTRVQFRDDGLFRQIWLIVSCALRPSLLSSFPMRGFVGRVSSLSVATDPRPFKVRSILLHRIASTHGARLWRLTYVSETCPLPSAPTLSGDSSGAYGNSSVDAGEETLARPT